MYADDLVLMAASVEGLQDMLNVCYITSLDVELEFNSKKCTCATIGQASKFSISNMKLGAEDIAWSSTFKYLGISFITGKRLLVNINSVKQKFYVAANCILSNANCNNELLKLNLIESHCLPILLFSSVSTRISVEQINELNIGWNSIYRRIFGFHKWESVKKFICGIGRLDFKSIRNYSRLKFVLNGLSNANTAFKSMLNMYLCTSEFREVLVMAGLKEQSFSSALQITISKVTYNVYKEFSSVCNAA